MRFIAILLLFLSLRVAAQTSVDKPSSDRTYVYKVSDAEAEEIFRIKSNEVPDSYFHTYLTSYQNSIRPNLEPGHYLFVSVENGAVRIKLESETDIIPFLLMRQGGPALILYDKKGEPITDAVIETGEHKTGYNYQEKVYVFNDPKPGLKAYKVRWKDQVGYFQGSYYGEMDFKEPKRSKKLTRSYLVFNKPKYFPGDTVKFKAFFVKKGKPVNAEAEANLYADDWQPKPIAKLAELEVKDGAVWYEFPLSDTLQLDETYVIKVRNKGKRWKFQARNSFRYEDYELNEMNIGLTVNKSTFYPSEEVVVQASAFDPNGNPAVEGKVTIEVETESIDTFISERERVPYILWKKSFPFHPSGQTAVVIPDSVFPKIEGAFLVHATFINSNNEIQKSVAGIEVLKAGSYLDIKIRGNSISAAAKGTKDSTASAVVTVLREAQVLDSFSVTLPFKDQIHPLATGYHFAFNKKTYREDLYPNSQGIAWTSSRTSDSASFEVRNPSDVVVYYSIFRNGELVKNGAEKEPSFAVKDEADARYKVILHYIENSQLKEESFCLCNDKEALQLDVDQPAKIQPGAETEVKVQVKDYQGFPVPAVNLTAASLNSKFGEPIFPYYFDKNTPGCGRGNFTGRTNYHNRDFSFPVDSAWAVKTGIDTTFSYKVYHPSPRFEAYESTEAERAEFKFYVTSKGRPELVNYAEIDGSPFYFNGLELKKKNYFKPAQEDVFHAAPGYHRFTFRTQDGVYAVDSVLLKKGKRLILSVDETFKQEKSKKADKELLNKLSGSLIPITSYEGNYLLLETGYGIQVINPKTTMLAGPFAGDTARLINRDTVYHVPVKKGVYYDLITDSLKTIDFNSKKDLKFKRKLLSSNKINYYSTSYIKRALNIQPEKFDKFYTLGSPKSKWGTGTYFYANNDKVRIAAIALIAKDTTIIRGWDNDPVYNIPPGNYLPAFLSDSGRVRTGDSIEVTGNQFLLDQQGLKEDMLQDWQNVFVTYGSVVQIIKGDGGSITRSSGKSANSYDGTDIYFSSNRLKDYSIKFYRRRGPYNTYGVELGGIVPGDFKFTAAGPYLGAYYDYRLNSVLGIYLNLKYAFIVSDNEQVNQYRHWITFAPQLNYRIRISWKKNLFLHAGAGLGYFDLNNGNLLNGIFPFGLDLKILRNVSIDYTWTLTTTDKLDGYAKGGWDSYHSLGLKFRLDPSRQALVCPARLWGGGSFSDRSWNSNAPYPPNPGLPGIAVNEEEFGINNISTPVTWDLNPTYHDAETIIFADSIASPLTNTNSNTGIRSNFRDYGYWYPNLTTGTDGKAIFRVKYPQDITGWNNYILAMDPQGRAGKSLELVKSFKPLTATLATPRFLIAGDTTEVIGKVVSYEDSSLQVTSTFASGNTNQSAQSVVETSQLDYFKLTSGSEDTLAVTFKAEGGTITDGEERKIPIIQQGMEERKGTFLVLEKDTSFTIAVDPEKGPLHLSVQNNTLDVMLQEIEGLKQYPYYCMEQTASKLLALLKEKEIKAALDQPFKGNYQIRKLVNKLEDNKNSNGSWGWWGRGSSDVPFTVHITKTLLEAKAKGYKVDITNSINYLVSVSSDKKSSYQWMALDLLSMAQMSGVKLPVLLSDLSDSIKAPVSLMDKLRKARFAQREGLPYSIEEVLQWSKRTVTGGQYWGQESFDLHTNSVQATILAYEFLKAEGGYEHELASIRQYFLESRKGGSWRNTYESAGILAAVVPDLIQEKQTPESKIVISETEVSRFPFHTIDSSSESVTVRYSGNAPAFVTWWQESWVSNPASSDSVFQVSTSFKTSEAEVQELSAGELSSLVVNLKTQAKAEHVMVEVPIPAGCSFHYEDQNIPGLEHRENHKEKAVLFFYNLEPGSYSFEIKLQPRYKGTYTLNPARASLMYFPVFCGNNVVRKVRIR